MITRGYFVAPHRVLSARMVSLCDRGFGALLLECSHTAEFKAVQRQYMRTVNSGVGLRCYMYTTLILLHSFLRCLNAKLDVE